MMSSSPIVLLVEPGDPAALCALQAGTGYELVVAPSAPEAVEALRRRPAALVIVDLERGGLALAHRVREVEGSAQVPVLFLATREQRPPIEGPRVDVAYKPVDETLLRNKVELFLTLTRLEHLAAMFAGVVGHELRNPLSAIMTSTQLAMKRATDESVKKPLERVLRGGDRMARMIDQLLELTRLRLNGSLTLSRSQVELREVVEHALRAARDAKTRFQVEALGDSSGSWDADRLLQVVATLVCNAVEHSLPGSPIQLRIDGRETGRVELRLHNVGPVLPPGLRDGHFDPFPREETPRPPRGLGLGLFLSQQFVVAHGGSFTVESSEGAGTTFTVELPRT